MKKKFLIGLVILIVSAAFVNCSESKKSTNLYQEFEKEYYKLCNIKRDYQYLRVMTESSVPINPSTNSKLWKIHNKYKHNSREKNIHLKEELKQQFDIQYKITLLKYVEYSYEFDRPEMMLLEIEDFKTSRIQETPFLVGRGMNPIHINSSMYQRLKEQKQQAGDEKENENNT